jgi:hypothetical protein
MTEIAVKKCGTIAPVRHGPLLAWRFGALQRLLLKHFLVALTGNLRILIGLLILGRYRRRGAHGCRWRGNCGRLNGCSSRARLLRFMVLGKPLVGKETDNNDNNKANHESIVHGSTDRCQIHNPLNAQSRSTQ